MVAKTKGIKGNKNRLLEFAVPYKLALSKVIDNQFSCLRGSNWRVFKKRLKGLLAIKTSLKAIMLL